MTAVLPFYVDGQAGYPYGQFLRVNEADTIRVTGDGFYRIVADTPSDLMGPVNTTAENPPPDNNLVCDRTGFIVPVKEGLVKEWTGLMVRKESRDPRHPQELVRPRPEHPKGSPRPEQPDVFTEDKYGTVGVTLNDLG